MARSQPDFNRLRTRVRQKDNRELYEKASVEYADYFGRTRSFGPVHTKKIYRLWLNRRFQRLWLDPIPAFTSESAREEREFRILVLAFGKGFTHKDGECLIKAWWQYHGIVPDQMPYMVFRQTIFMKAWLFTEPARSRYEERQRAKREAAERKRSDPSKTANRIKGILSNGPVSVDGVTEQLGDVNRAAIKKQLQRMHQRGEAEKMSSGQYRLNPTETRNPVILDAKPAPDPLSEEENRLLRLIQIEYPVDAAKFRDWQAKDFFRDLIDRLKLYYDSSEPSPPVAESQLGESPKARLPF
jgi:hypothetical protein